jgi:hypothetical protein
MYEADEEDAWLLHFSLDVVCCYLAVVSYYIIMYLKKHARMKWQKAGCHPSWRCWGDVGDSLDIPGSYTTSNNGSFFYTVVSPFSLMSL